MEAVSGHKENHLGRGSIRAGKSGPGESWRRHAPSGSFSRKKASSREDFSFLFFQMRETTTCLHNDLQLNPTRSLFSSIRVLWEHSHAYFVFELSIVAFRLDGRVE